MMRSLLLLVLVLLGGCTDRKPAAPPAPRLVRSQNSGPGTVVSIEPVRVTSGFEVWRNGHPLTVQDGLLIRLDGLNPMEFEPRGITPPLFVLGDTVGVTLGSPFMGGRAVLLMAAPPPDSEVALWVTDPGQSPEKLLDTVLRTAQLSALSADASGGINIRTPPAGTPRATYPTENELAVVALSLKAPELCAELGKQCGTPTTQVGMIDCGTCPAGQVCTPANQCCTAETHTQFCSRLALNCGAVSGTDNCGLPRYVQSCGTCAVAEFCSGNRCQSK